MRRSSFRIERINFVGRITKEEENRKGKVYNEEKRKFFLWFQNGEIGLELSLEYKT